MAETETESLLSYTVIADAVTIDTGRKNIHTNKPEVVRVLKGSTINAPEGYPSLQPLIDARAVRLTSKVKGNETLTTLAVYRLGQTSGEGGEKVDTEVVPLSATTDQVREHTEE